VTDDCVFIWMITRYAYGYTHKVMIKFVIFASLLRNDPIIFVDTTVDLMLT